MMHFSAKEDFVVQREKKLFWGKDSAYRGKAFNIQRGNKGKYVAQCL